MLKGKITYEQNLATYKWKIYAQNCERQNNNA